MTKQFSLTSTVRLSLLSSLALTFTTCPNLMAEESMSTEEWDITADRIIRYEKPQSIVAEGNIVLVKRKKLPPKTTKIEESVSDWALLLEEEIPETTEVTPADIEEAVKDVYKTEVTIKSDWVAYDVALNSIKARGNVSIKTEEDQLFAEEATVNLENETGTFTNATIIRDEHDLHVEGEVIEKTGYKTYHVENGWVITCKVESGKTAPWSLAVSDAEIEQDGYAVLKHARFRVKDIPLLYTPWMVVPVKNKRQTGLLFPEFSSSENSGFGFNIPFFWNISDSTDATIYTQYLADRGYMPSLELRYVKSDTDKGVVMGTYLHDELSDPSETDYYTSTGYTHDNKDRYWIRGKFDHEFGDGWTTRLDLDIVSDEDYLTEFNSGMTGYSDTNDYFLDVFGRSLENKTDTQRENMLKTLKSWGSQSLVVEFLAINDVSNSDTEALWKLPEVEYDGAISLGGFGDLSLDWDTSYVNYWREEGIGGHRVDLYPKLSAPLPISDYLESRAEIGLRDTFYVVEEYGDETWDGDSTANRFLYDLHVEIGSTLMRTFGLSGEKYTGLTHQIRPYVEYDYTPEEDQDDNPYFSGIDRIGEQNQISYGIDQFFDLLSPAKASEDDKTEKEDADESSALSDEETEYGYIKISQSYSLLDDDSDEPFSDIYAKIKWVPVRSANIVYKTYFDVYGEGFVSHNLEGIYNTSRGDRFGLEYIFTESTDTEQINVDIEAALIANWFIDLEVEHSISEEETNEANVSLIYRAPCWSVEFQSEYTPDDTSFMVIFNLANLGSPFGLHY